MHSTGYRENLFVSFKIIREHQSCCLIDLYRISSSNFIHLEYLVYQYVLFNIRVSLSCICSSYIKRCVFSIDIFLIIVNCSARDYELNNELTKYDLNSASEKCRERDLLNTSNLKILGAVKWTTIYTTMLPYEPLNSIYIKRGIFTVYMIFNSYKLSITFFLLI